MDVASQVLVFSHIPKNAGTSLVAALRAAIGDESSIGLRMQKIENIRSSRLAESTNEVFMRGRKLAAGLSGRHYLARGRRRDIRNAALIHGHFCIGEEPRTGRQPLYISVVREPIDRFISYFHYRKDQLPRLMHDRKSHPLLDTDGFMPESPMAYLDMLVKRGTRTWRNPQVRYFSPAGTFTAARNCIAEKNVITAPSTRLGDFARVLDCDLGIGPLTIEHRNKGISRAKAAEWPLSRSEKDRIRGYFDEDCRLFELVTSTFAERLGEMIEHSEGGAWNGLQEPAMPLEDPRRRTSYDLHC